MAFYCHPQIKKISKAPKATSGFIAGPSVLILQLAEYIALRSIDRRAHLYPLQLHLLPEIARRRLNELLLGVPGTVAFFVLQEHHVAAHITGGDDRGLHQRIIGSFLKGIAVTRRRQKSSCGFLWELLLSSDCVIIGSTPKNRLIKPLFRIHSSCVTNKLAKIQKTRSEIGHWTTPPL